MQTPAPTRQLNELAVQWACQGTRMNLNRDERVLAVKLMLGRVPVVQIADRIGICDRSVSRIVRALDTVKCPLCQNRCWHNDGILADHLGFDGTAVCLMSGCHHQDRAAAYARRGWLADRPEDPEKRRRRRRKTVPA